MSVLTVNDEPAVRDALRRSLAFEGYETALAADGLDALEQSAAREPESITLEVLMPRMDGLTAARRLRAAGPRVPILVLTARDTLGDRGTGLDAGADGYLVKPFGLDELLAHAHALPRRGVYGAGADAGPATREVARAGRPVELTGTGFTLPEMFLAHPRQVLSRERIPRAVWGFPRARLQLAGRVRDVPVRQDRGGRRRAPADPDRARGRLRSVRGRGVSGRAGSGPARSGAACAPVPPADTGPRA